MLFDEAYKGLLQSFHSAASPLVMAGNHRRSVAMINGRLGNFGGSMKRLIHLEYLMVEKALIDEVGYKLIRTYNLCVFNPNAIEAFLCGFRLSAFHKMRQ